jgi:hypothetical protein
MFSKAGIFKMDVSKQPCNRKNPRKGRYSKISRNQPKNV